MRRHTDGVFGQLGEGKGLGHDALGAHGGITVDDDAQRLLAALAQVLLGPDLALRHRIGRLEVRGVVDQGDVQVLALVLQIDGLG